MSVYDRTNNLPEEVASLQKNVDEVKQMQIIGNDNLVTNFYGATFMYEYDIDANATAIFKTTFTFDSPSDNYLQIFYYWYSMGATTYNENRYADPLTVNDRTKKSFYMIITPTVFTQTVIMEPIIKSSMNGTLLFERIS